MKIERKTRTAQHNKERETIIDRNIKNDWKATSERIKKTNETGKKEPSKEWNGKEKRREKKFKSNKTTLVVVWGICFFHVFSQFLWLHSFEFQWDFVHFRWFNPTNDSVYLMPFTFMQFFSRNSLINLYTKPSQFLHSNHLIRFGFGSPENSIDTVSGLIQSYSPSAHLYCHFGAYGVWLILSLCHFGNVNSAHVYIVLLSAHWQFHVVLSNFPVGRRFLIRTDFHPRI